MGIAERGLRLGHLLSEADSLDLVWIMILLMSLHCIALLCLGSNVDEFFLPGSENTNISGTVVRCCCWLR